MFGPTQTRRCRFQRSVHPRAGADASEAPPTRSDLCVIDAEVDRWGLFSQPCREEGAAASGGIAASPLVSRVLLCAYIGYVCRSASFIGETAAVGQRAGRRIFLEAVRGGRGIGCLHIGSVDHNTIVYLSGTMGSLVHVAAHIGTETSPIQLYRMWFLMMTIEEVIPIRGEVLQKSPLKIEEALSGPLAPWANCQALILRRRTQPRE